jgi:hypothetical protein
MTILSKIISTFNFIHITSIFWFGINFYKKSYLSNLLFLNNISNNNDNDSDSDLSNDDLTNDNDNDLTKVKDIKYEDKYLTQVREMTNEYFFTEDELEIEKQQYDLLYDLELNKINDEIKWLEEEISEFKTHLLYNVYDKYEDIDNEDIDNDDNDIEPNEEKLGQYLIDDIKLKIKERSSKLYNLKLITVETIETKAREQARQFIIGKQLMRFKNNFVVEMTPIGNVLLYYNHDKLSFEYYSDNTIPYRYLEVVARKYTLVNRYRPLYLDMEEELKKYELEQTKADQTLGHALGHSLGHSLGHTLENNETTDKVTTDKVTTDKVLDKVLDKKKDVFAKFKTYNKEGGSGHINTAPPPKNSIPQNKINTAFMKSGLKEKEKDKENNESERLLLKERANRYSYQGKFANFSFLQKIDKKKVDKNYALSYAEYKKLCYNK